MPKIKAPLLIHLAENDQRINEMYPTYEQELKKAGVRYEIQRSGGEARLGADRRLLQEESGLRLARAAFAACSTW